MERRKEAAGIEAPAMEVLGALEVVGHNGLNPSERAGHFR